MENIRLVFRFSHIIQHGAANLADIEVAILIQVHSNIMYFVHFFGDKLASFRE